MLRKPVLFILSMTAVVGLGQQVGTFTSEVHPTLLWAKCTKSGGCTAQSQGRIVIDSSYRWLHDKNGYTNCYTTNSFNSTICPDGKSCAVNCALDGADYRGTYGITAKGSSLTLKFVTSNSAGTNVGSRVFLMASDTSYEMFKPLNQEFSFDIDVSELGCGLNGALYFAQMDADGGMTKYPTNKAGAKYGTGYCDSKCARDCQGTTP